MEKDDTKRADFSSGNFSRKENNSPDASADRRQKKGKKQERKQK